MQSKLAELAAAGIDVVALSADLEEHAAERIKESGLTFPIGFGLTEADMKALGLYVSHPKNYQEHISHTFSEPAWFYLSPEGTIVYADYGSAPMAGRINVDTLLAAKNWVAGEAARVPAFKQYIWGTVQL